MDDIIKEFLVESLEGLDQLERDFVELEKNPGDSARLANIFRCIHTIKGTCGFLGFSKLETVTHRGENLLSKMREGTLHLNPVITSALLSLVDAVRSIMACIEEDGTEGPADFSDLIDLLTKIHSGQPITIPEGQPIAVSEEHDEPLPSVAERDDVPPSVPSQSGGGLPAAILEGRSIPSAAALTVPSEREDGQPITGPHRHPERTATTEVSGGSPSISDSSIRVNVELLDQLMNLVGELVLARNQVLQYSAHQNNPLLNATAQRLNLITSELQEGVMKTRMQPIGSVWSKIPRVARDLAMACDKKVRVQMEGKGTELDKTLIEAIKDPLTHIVRNAIDHGLELPQERRQAGKDETGVLRLRAYHEGGQVNIEIDDDGGGIDPTQILQRALNRGLLTSEQASQMSDRDIVNL
ncbi:MAG: Hpt domain-containing protein, partial [Myxococcota bacterium]